MCRKLILPVVVALIAGSARADLVGHWTFDEGQGTTAYDSSGNDHHGTLQGDPQWVTGYIGGALELDGTDDYVEVPDDEGLHLWETFTLAAWIYQLESGSSRIIDKIGAGTANGPHFDTHPGTRLRCCSGTCISTTADHTLEQWHHVAVTFDEGDVKIYLDGAVAAEGSVPSPLAGNSLSLRIGAASDGGSLFHGLIDDVRVYNHALTETEIGAAMEGEAVPFAFGPSPGNGSMEGQTSVTLQWQPGDFAVSHDLYFGESFGDVNQATPESDAFQGNQTATQFPLPDLTPGATYYWRVDEVNDANAASPWKGTVWSFWIQPATAWNPAPADGVEFVDPEGGLTWQPGMETLFHTVYLGASFDEVNEAIADGFMIADAAYNPGPLELDTTYYWRVDEFTMTGTVKGEVWSFRTMPEIPVSDPNLALWYRLDEAQGGTAIDWSGHGNHAAITGEPLWTQNGYDWAALQLGGKNYLTVPNSDRMKLTSSGAYSVALHIKLENTRQQAIFYHGLGCSTWASWFLGVAGGEPGIATVPGNFVFGVREANGTDYVSVSAPARANAWVHVAATYDGSMLRLYVDGQEMSVAAVPLPWDSDEDLYIGADPGCGGRVYSTAVIDDLRLYDRTLTEEEITEIMRVNLSLAWNPQPGRGSIVDIRDATALSWKTGDAAASHDVYFGQDRDAVATADNDAADFQGNQPAASFPLTGLVALGGGDYYWRVDEIEADGTVQTGYIWKFTIPDYLVVADFESYTNEVGSRVFEAWIDGIGFTLPEPGHLGNGTGAAIGHDIWTGGFTNLMETADVHGGAQAMPIYYDNTSAPFRSEADRTFTPGQNWTVEGVTTLVVHFRGEADNTGDLYIEINDARVPYDDDPADIASGNWIAWEIDLASVGVSLTNVTTMTIGIEGGQAGVVYVDDIILTKP